MPGPARGSAASGGEKASLGHVRVAAGGGLGPGLGFRELLDLAESVAIAGQAAVEDVPKIQAPLLLHYGELDERINAGWPDYEAALKANNKTFEGHIYAGANHGFHNDSTPRYDEAMAELSWDRTIAWFNQYLT